MNRRTFAAALLGACSVSGCLGSSIADRSPEETVTERTGAATPDPTDRTTVAETETTGGHPLTNWERSTDCVTTEERDDMDAMYDSVIKVAGVAEELPDGYAPIHFSKLPAAEKKILRAVTTEGGYGTCDPSEAFHRFVERVANRGERQDADRMHVYLERDGTYYRLYVEVTDQVFAY